MKNKQAGGIVSFIIVALALAGLLAGGLYLSKQQGRTAHDNNTSVPQVSTTENNKPQEKTTQQGSNTSDNKSDNSTTPTPQQSTQGSGSQNQAPTNQATPTPQSNRVANTGPSENLPSTGPGETAAVTLALSALAFTGFRLMQSRRVLRRSALRK